MGTKGNIWTSVEEEEELRKTGVNERNEPFLFTPYEI